MGMLDGWAEDALKDFGGDFLPATLHVPTEGDPDGQGGFIPGAPVNHSCLAIVTDWRDYRRATLGIPATDRKILVLAASLPAGVRPTKGQSITAQDSANGFQPRTFEIIEPGSDPAVAVWTLQGR